MSKTQIFIISALTGFLLVASLIAGLVIVPIVKQNKAIENARIERQMNLVRYESCMAEAYDNYDTNWENNCQAKGLGQNCSLSGNLANDLDSIREKEENFCIKMFSN